MRGRGARGFTLTELLITLGVIVVILSLSVGVLRRLGHKEELVATQQAVRALLRAARNAAREERYEVTVTIDPEASELRAQQKTVVTQFHFETPGSAAGPSGASAGEHDATAGPSAGATREDNQASRDTLEGARGYRIELEDVDPARGKVGQGLLFERTHRRGAAWAWVDHTPALAAREGVHVACAVFLGRLDKRLLQRQSQEERSEGEPAYERAGPFWREAPPRVNDYDPANPPVFCLLRKGKAYGLAVTASYELEASVSGTSKDGAEVTYVSRTQPYVLEPNRWYRIELAFDGRVLRVIVDGIARQHLPLAGSDVLPERLRSDDAPFSLSDPDPRRAFFGVIDELKLAAVTSAQRVPVPADIALIAPSATVRFDMLGQLDPAKHAEPFVLYLCNAADVGDVLDPEAPAGKKGDPKRTRTRAEQQEEAEEVAKAKIALGQHRFQRFAQALPNLQERQVRRLVVERTGLVGE
ncbi:MAG: prepilin-type N-terminal cleavage/methylation domain-containing protein [Planctomycetota bacterium]